jgi:hypothetical protein
MVVLLSAQLCWNQRVLTAFLESNLVINDTAILISQMPRSILFDLPGHGPSILPTAPEESRCPNRHQQGTYPKYRTPTGENMFSISLR